MNSKNPTEMIVVTEIGPSPDHTSHGRIERGIGDRMAKATLNNVNVAVLKENMAGFFLQLREILDVGREKIGLFSIDEVKISAQISGDGQVCLMGSGVKVGVQGGITFVLKREIPD